MSYSHLNYARDLEKITGFIQQFKDNQGTDKYLSSLVSQKMIDQKLAVADRSVDSITVELDDVASFLGDDLSLLENIENNTKRYRGLFYKAFDSLMPESNAPLDDDSSPLEVIMSLRKQRDQQREGTGEESFPPMLTRRYTMYFKPRSSDKAVSVREVRPESLGGLVTIRGMVTRVSNVKPLAAVIALSCDKCGSEVFQEVASGDVTPITECPSEECVRNNARGKLYLQTRACKFLKFQEVKIQELTDQVPMGHIPRSMTVHLYENMCRKVSPGDNVLISGIFIPVPYSGFRAMRAGLLTDTVLEAQFINHVKKQYREMVLTPEIHSKIEELAQDPYLYNRLAKSIAPEIYGHEDIKKALLLLLVGGVTKETPDGMKIRGDLNMCLMGDPGVAKSQLLKHIAKVAPRSVYTTGRGSSGVGLTASVIRDPVTEELVLEGGALVLADNGIACIDEFDKMDENDRTAIHEVMEQQTISISKAGITTTLNARTSILAAANPYYGRYDRRKKATENINLPAALLSRFDLLFLILDTPNPEDDLRLAQHVTYVHMHNRHPSRQNESEAIDAEVMRHYIALARDFNPRVSTEVADFIVSAYIRMRHHVGETADFQYTCARTLLSIVRMATALARLRFSEEVDISDAQEAMRLIDVSKASLIDQKHQKSRDPISVIFDEIKLMSTKANKTMYKEIVISDVRERLIRKGYSEEQLQQCIDSYERMDVWMRTSGGTKLRWTEITEFDDEEL